MKNILNKYVYLSLFLALSFVVTSCFDDDSFESDVSKVVPKVYNFNGPTLAFQSTSASYSVGLRGGSEYTWNADNGAEITHVGEGMVDIFFAQGGDVTITVTEQSSNGKISEPAILVVEVACNPQDGDYRVVLHDSYGDGWQTDVAWDVPNGAGITVTLNNGTVIEVGMCSPYQPSAYSCVNGDWFDAETTVTIPPGILSAVWNFPGDIYGEISFEIYAPDGSLVFESGAPGDQAAGQLPIVVCVV